MLFQPNITDEQGLQKALNASASFTVELLENLMKAHRAKASEYKSKGATEKVIKLNKMVSALQAEKERFSKEMDSKVTGLLKELTGSSTASWFQCQPLRAYDLLVPTDELTVSQVIALIQSEASHKKSLFRNTKPSMTSIP